VLHRLLPHLTRVRLLASHRIAGVWHVDLSSRQRSATCPRCHHRSTAVHSSYPRTVADLPIAGTQVLWHLRVRRFFCRRTACPRRIFAERFSSLVPVRSRHSVGVCTALSRVGCAVGSRAGARLAHALGLPGSSRTILRFSHRMPFPPMAAPRVIGLDEWAWRRGRRFGTIVWDLERHRVLDLLPERSASSVAPWLQAHSPVEIVCRARSGLYAEGIRQGAPQAIQVVDRFHLVQHLRDALERLFLRYRRALNTLGASLRRASEPTPTLATLSRARHARWVHRYHPIQRLHAQRLGVAAIARQVQVSRPTVYRYLAMPQPPERQRFRHRGPLLMTPFIPYLRRRWNAGCRNAHQLWRELVAQGHRPSRMTVERYVGQLRRATGTRRKFRQVPPAPLYDAHHPEGSPPPLTALRAARLFLATPEARRSSDQPLLAHRLRLDPVLPRTYRQVQTFCRMVRERRGHQLDAWVAAVQQTGVKELRAFAKRLLKDASAVRAGLSLVWSNGPTEGVIHRLKLLKRQAYGRAGVDFLRHRILGPSAGAGHGISPLLVGGCGLRTHTSSVGE
jgi:transposase